MGITVSVHSLHKIEFFKGKVWEMCIATWRHWVANYEKLDTYGISGITIRIKVLKYCSIIAI